MGEFVHPGKGHIILFEHWQFHGRHRHVFKDESNLDTLADQPQDKDFSIITSSIVVLEGTWEFFKESGFKEKIGELGPGQYPDFNFLPGGLDVWNDKISSLNVKPCDPITW
jgi:hypothetical protein